MLTSCVAAAIGDDVRAVCSEASGCPVIVIPTGGFLGGGFSDGMTIGACRALLSLPRGQPVRLGEPGGEKNLEFEAEANYREVARLLSLHGGDRSSSALSGISLFPRSGALDLHRSISCGTNRLPMSALPSRIVLALRSCHPSRLVLKGRSRSFHAWEKNSDIGSDRAISAERDYQRRDHRTFFRFEGKGGHGQPLRSRLQARFLPSCWNCLTLN